MIKQILRFTLLVIVLTMTLGCAAAMTGKGGLKPSIYKANYDEVYIKGVEAISNKGWTIEFTDRETGIINARTGVSLSTWGDVVSIRISRQANGEVQVNASSRTERQALDWGKNTRNIKEYLVELDKLMLMSVTTPHE